MEGMEHFVYGKIQDVSSLLQIVMLSLISQMLRNGQVLISPAYLAIYSFIIHSYEDYLEALDKEKEHYDA